MMFDVSGNTSRTDNLSNQFDLSSSLWSEFFHTYRNDKFTGSYYTNNSSFKPQYFIDKPVYILPMITFHIGHIYIDLIEEIYTSMMNTYGKIRHDCIIIIDVAGKEERNILKEKLINTYWTNKNNSFGLIIKSLIGDRPFFSMDLISELNKLGGVVFSDLHIGLDISESFYYEGYKNHPCIMSMHPNIATQRTIDLSSSYKRFSSYIKSSYDGKTISELNFPSTSSNNGEKRLNVLFIQRTKNRIILNIDQLESLADSYGLNWIECDLNGISFDDQMHLFSQTDILVKLACQCL